jgi:hypothetical protein
MQIVGDQRGKFRLQEHPREQLQDLHYTRVPEMRAQTPTTSYRLHAELGKNIQKIPSKNKMTSISRATTPFNCF